MPAGNPFRMGKGALRCLLRSPAADAVHCNYTIPGVIRLAFSLHSRVAGQSDVYREFIGLPPPPPLLCGYVGGQMAIYDTYQPFAFTCLP